MANKTPLATIRQAASAALSAADQLLPEWLPDGKRQGAEWLATNVARGDRSPGSFSINMHTGKWNDFADQEARGGDLVALLAYLRGCKQLEAAREINRTLGLAPLSAETSEQRQQRIARNKLARSKLQKAADKAAKEKEAAQQQAAATAKRRWSAARPASADFQYLAAKQVRPYNLRQDANQNLLIPIFCAGELANLQIIDPAGRKRFLKGGKVKGCYAQIGQHSPWQPIYICEGWSTGASIHADTGCLVYCAMTAANLLPVAEYLRAHTGDNQKIIIAGDDDRQQKGNPGREAAYEAARNINAKVVFPGWPDNAPLHLSDFNDLQCWLAESLAKEAPL